jgi:hypothetical protein
MIKKIPKKKAAIKFFDELQFIYIFWVKSSQYTSEPHIACMKPEVFIKKSSWTGEVKLDVLKLVVTLHVQMSRCFY